MRYIAKLNLKYKGEIIKAGEEHPEPNKGLIESGFIEAVEDAAPQKDPVDPSGDADQAGEPNVEPAAHDADAEPAPAAEDEAVEEKHHSHKHHAKKKHKR